MPARAPAIDELQPRHTLVPAGTTLWRVHPWDHAATDFRTEPAHPYFDGGRFDATSDDPYPYLYLAATPETAVAEAVLRSTRFAVDGYRFVPLASVAGRLLSPVRIRTELRLISLVSAVDLAAVGQDSWLVDIDEQQYGLTRYWSGRLREASPEAQGLVWQSNRDRPHGSMLLFGDRCPAHALGRSGHGTIDLASNDGIEWLNELMAPYRLMVAPSSA